MNSGRVKIAPWMPPVGPSPTRGFDGFGPLAEVVDLTRRAHSLDTHTSKSASKSDADAAHFPWALLQLLYEMSKIIMLRRNSSSHLVRALRLGPCRYHHILAAEPSRHRRKLQPLSAPPQLSVPILDKLE